MSIFNKKSPSRSPCSGIFVRSLAISRAISLGTKYGDPNGPICAIMVALYITQDSFGTACNVSGDNAIGVVVNAFYTRMIAQEKKA